MSEAEHPATSDDIREAVAVGKRLWRWAIAVGGVSGLAALAAAGYGTVAAAQEVPAIKRRLNEIEMNVYFLCLMQEAAVPEAHAAVEAKLKLKVECRRPAVDR